jgi:hypothetical protein
MVSDRTVVLDSDASSSRVTALEQGVEPALVELRDRLGPTVSMVGRGGYSMLPPPLHEQLAGRHEVVARAATDTGELVVARSGSSVDEPAESWRIGVAWVRMGAAERLSKRATDRLSQRRIQGRPTIGLPLVRAAVGDVACWLGEAHYLLTQVADEDQPLAWTRIEQNLESAVRTSLKLFGASGYVVGPPADLAFAITYLGDVYAGTDLRTPR